MVVVMAKPVLRAGWPATKHELYDRTMTNA